MKVQLCLGCQSLLRNTCSDVVHVLLMAAWREKVNDDNRLIRKLTPCHKSELFTQRYIQHDLSLSPPKLRFKIKLNNFRRLHIFKNCKQTYNQSKKRITNSKKSRQQEIRLSNAYNAKSKGIISQHTCNDKRTNMSKDDKSGG